MAHSEIFSSKTQDNAFSKGLHNSDKFNFKLAPLPSIGSTHCLNEVQLFSVIQQSMLITRWYICLFINKESEQTSGHIVSELGKNLLNLIHGNWDKQFFSSQSEGNMLLLFQKTFCRYALRRMEF